MKRLLLTCTDLMAIQFLVPHIEYLSQNDFSVELACSDVGGRIDELRDRLNGVASVRVVRLVRSPFSPGNLKGYSDLKKIINSERWDVIWTNEPVMGVMTRLAARKARKSGTKVIYMAHGFHFYKGAPKINWMIYYPVEKFCSRLCDTIVTINNEDFERAKKFHAKSVEKINGIGVDLSEYAPNDFLRCEKRKELNVAEDETLLFTVGELTHRKNQHILIEALALLNNPKIKLAICGCGDLECKLKDKAKSLGVSEQVQFLGYRKDACELYNAADIFVFSSLQEGLPRAVMEAMANGKPVVCSNIRGNVDLIENGVNGFMCAPDDVNGFAEHINRFFSDRNLLARVSENNIKCVEKFNIEEVKKQVFSLVIKVAGERT